MAIVIMLVDLIIGAATGLKVQWVTSMGGGAN